MANVVSSLVDIQYAKNEKVGERLNELFENIDRNGEATCEAVYGNSASEDDDDLTQTEIMSKLFFRFYFK